MAELARDRLHRDGVEVFGLEHDRERVAGKAALGEHVEGDETAAHGGLLHTVAGRKISLGATISYCASISSISHAPAAAVRRRIPNTDEVERASASAAEPLRSRWAKNSAAMASPAPLIASGSFGVRRRKRPVGSDTRRSTAPGGVSAVCSDVTRTTRGPSA